MSDSPTDQSASSRRGVPTVALILSALAIVAFTVALGAFMTNTFNRLNSQATPTPEDPNAVAIVDEAQQSTGISEVEPKAISNHTLTNNLGESVSLADFAGQYTLLYFGYTFCPDFCPTTMTDYRLVKRGLGQDAEQVAFVFISVDPKRDTPELLNAYVQRFDPEIVALTGDADTLKQVADEFGAFFQSHEADDPQFYMVDHTATKFLVDPQGNWIAQYAFGTPVEVITEDLKQRLAAD